MLRAAAICPVRPKAIVHLGFSGTPAQRRPVRASPIQPDIRKVADAGGVRVVAVAEHSDID